MQFGSYVVAQGTLRRTGDYIPNGRDKVYWVPVIWSTPKTGLLIGWRTLSNGEVSAGSYDEGATYHPKEYFKVGLVVFNEHTNPFYVPLNLLHDV